MFVGMTSPPRCKRPYIPEALSEETDFFTAGGAPECSEAEGVHFGFFIAAVFPRIAQAVFEAAGLFCQGPYQTLARWQRIGLALENGIVESPPCVNPLPALIGERRSEEHTS